MPEMDVSKAFEELDRRFKAAIEAFPELRRQMHEEAGAAIQVSVRSKIAASGMKGGAPYVRGWQEKYVGSGGGYAAVRPEPGGERGKNPGAITNYLEHGHKVRKPSGNAKRRRKSRARKQFVDGYYFYDRARAEAQETAIGAASRLLDGMAERLGD